MRPDSIDYRTARPGTEPMAVTQNYSLRLDADRRAKLEQIALRKDRDLSYVIRKAIDEYIERHQNDPD
jgi:predicted transcriptional regulator